MKGKVNQNYYLTTHGPVQAGQNLYKQLNGRQTYSSLNTTVSISEKIQEQLISRAL